MSEPGAEELAVVRGVVRELASGQHRARAVPRLPAVVPQLLDSLRDPDASARDFVEIIQTDPLIAGSVLRVVNSAYYNPAGQHIDSFHRAVVILGLDGLRFALSSAVLHPIIETASDDYPRFGDYLWSHSMQCALACQVMARQADIDPFKAYLAGLVHDVGAVALFNQVSQAFRASQKATVPLAALFYAIDRQAPNLTVAIAGDWQLPDEIRIALSEQPLIDERGAGRSSSLGELLCAANLAAEAYLLRRLNLPAAVTIPGGDALFREMDQLTGAFDG